MHRTKWISHKKLFNQIGINTMKCVVHKSHYESLNIAKTATHKEIKDAYYRLSMIYHPDKNKGSEEAAKMFRDITAAYEVLGNVRQKRLYDTGVTGATSIKKSSPFSAPFGRTSNRNEEFKPTARSRDYKFEEWSRTHYSNSFQQQNASKDYNRNRKEAKEFVAQQRSYIAISFVFTTTLFVLLYMVNLVSQSVAYKNIGNFPKNK